MTLAEINAMDKASFVSTLGGIYEHSPWVAERALGDRPFASVSALHAAMDAAVARALDSEKLALLRAHPELAGRAAVRGELTADSTKEQSGAGLAQCSPAEFAQLTGYNTLQRQARISVHPCGQGLRSRRDHSRVCASR